MFKAKLLVPLTNSLAQLRLKERAVLTAETSTLHRNGIPSASTLKFSSPVRIVEILFDLLSTDTIDIGYGDAGRVPP